MTEDDISCLIIQVIEICICRSPGALSVCELYIPELYYFVDQYLLEELQTVDVCHA